MTFTGYLSVEVGNKLNKSIITNSFFDGVLKITRPIYLADGLPLLTLIHVGGGYVDGDSYQTEVVVNESASLALTTQAAMKIYKSPRFGVTQSTDYFLKDHSELYVKQDSLIPYKDAKFTQYTNVYMSSSAIFYYTDIITPGWSEDGKLFQYQQVTSKFKISVDGSLEVFDHLLLQPSDQLEALMNLEGFTHIGTMFFIHQKINDAFIAELREKCSNDSKRCRIGISRLNINGMAIRILAKSTPVIETIFTECERFIWERLYSKEKIEWRKG